MPAGQSHEILTYRVVLGAVSTVAFVLIMLMVNGIDAKFKKLFDKTDDIVKEFSELKGKCEERHK